MSTQNLKELESERREKESRARTSMYEKLTSSGEKERIKDLLRQRLIQCGWRDELKKHTKVRDKESINDLTVDSLVAEITPKARDSIPDEIKVEVLQAIRAFIEKND